MAGLEPHPVRPHDEAMPPMHTLNRILLVALVVAALVQILVLVLR